MCEVEEGVYVPFTVHANLTLNVCEGTCFITGIMACMGEATVMG